MPSKRKLRRKRKAQLKQIAFRITVEARRMAPAIIFLIVDCLDNGQIDGSIVTGMIQ